MALISTTGSLELGNNWFKTGVVLKRKNIRATGKSFFGLFPGFIDEANLDYRLAPGSPVTKVAGPLNKISTEQIPTRQYAPRQSSKPRPTVHDLGAFESVN